MAGVKGRSGGPRPNSGGARPGAGRKPKPKAPPVVIAPEVAKVEDGEPLDPRPTLELVALGHMEVSPQQLKALLALLPYTNTKKGEGGKKDEAADKAKKAGSGKFGAAPPPLALVKR
jgi:phage terminase small subunit